MTASDTVSDAVSDAVDLAKIAPLPRSFYDRPTLRVARDLLGCVLVHHGDGGPAGGMIVEVEAYLGPTDRGAHSFGGRRTPRNEVMWGEPGHAYVYFTYGMHFCLNAVTRPAGVPQAVLLRALEPLVGVDVMRLRRGGRAPATRLASGPGSLCRALAIDRGRNGADLTRPPLAIYGYRRIAARDVARTRRIGIDYAAEYAAKPWRFVVRGHPAVSGPKITSRGT